MKEGKIAVVEKEAEPVRSIIRRYLEVGSVNELVRDLKARNLQQGSNSSRPEEHAEVSRSAAGRYSISSVATFMSAKSNTRT